MGYHFKASGLNDVLQKLSGEYKIFAPKRIVGGGTFTDTDCVRYEEISSVEEIVFDEKTRYSAKEVLNPIQQVLFYFTEGNIKESDPPEKGAIVFLRSCDLHGVKRFDEVYLNTGNPDYYYERIRKNIKFVLMGCPHCFDSCFCVDMGTNKSDQYDISIDVKDGDYFIDCKLPEWDSLLKESSLAELPVTPEFVTETKTHVAIPENLSDAVANSTIWDEYDGRCINCGRCNVVCPTCTCYTMQDIFYTDNARTGERRRVWASCMIDGFSDMAGGVTYRDKNGQRMRYKVLHKVLHFKNRVDYQMCIGCGRCEDVCPEYISYIRILNNLGKAMEEVSE